MRRTILPIVDTPTMIFRDPLMHNVVERARKIASTNCALLISGETGTGKEMIARFVHQQSSRRQNPYIAVNCAAIPEGLLETELFGHERGAFSGALDRKAGKMEMASGGTLLLDEISELDIRLQAKLLRAIQEQEIDRVGSYTSVKIDARIIATTNKNLPEEIRLSRFRPDLYYRLSAVTIHIPSLRDRPDDILALADYFLSKYALDGVHQKTIFNAAAKRQLTTYDWPGNVRELENIVRRAVIFSTEDLISADLLEIPCLPSLCPSVGAADPPKIRNRTLNILKIHERNAICAALRQSSGNRARAAELLGISSKTLRKKLRLYNGAPEFELRRAEFS